MKIANIVVLLVALILLGGCAQEISPPPDAPGPEAPQTQTLVTEAVDLSGIQTEGISLAQHYALDPLEVTLQVPPYELPLKTGDIKNYNDFLSKIELGGAADMLFQNGFVIIRNPFNPKGEDITTPYDDLKENEIPIFITTDSLLHLYHIQFDETLRQIEEREFYGKIWNISEALLEDSLKTYGSSTGEVKEAARKNAAYLAVALSLLQPNESQTCQEEYEYECAPGLFGKEEAAQYTFEIPETVQDDVEAELKLIGAHGGFEDSPLFTYKEDYSQYVPRGHYTRSEKLKNYFRAMMWYGRLAFLLNGGEPYGPDAKYLVSAEEARLQTTGALFITGKFAESEALRTDWERIYAVTSFYVGLSDDLGPYEYLESMQKVFGGGFSAGKLTDDAFLDLKAEFAALNGPRIYGGTGECTKVINPAFEDFSPENLDECLGKSKGFRLMGQRFIPDSYMLSEIVSPNVGELQRSEAPFTACLIPDYGYMRCFPRGLDVMALLGSERAREVLTELGEEDYERYDVQFANLSAEFEGFSAAEWNKNLYWSWLYSLKALLKEPGAGYPTFMQTEAWHDRTLTAALASWAELRHDTILYAKQSYTMTMSITSVGPPPPPEKPVVGYVEPVPEFYNRLLALTRMTTKGLDEMGVLDSSSKSRLNELERILARLVKLSEKELENVELEQEDYDFIKNFGKELNGVIADVEAKAKKTTIIADVHTDQNTKQVLEEGIGYVDLMVVAYKVPDGRILVGAGPVMTYYEFKHPMDDRLTDEKWREMLQGSEAPERPEWTSSFTS